MKQFLNAHNCLFAIKRALTAAILLLLAGAHSSASFANPTNPPEFELVGIEMQQDGSWQLAFHIKLAGGWKTYWTEPGPFGIPPVLTVENGQNIAGVNLLLPEPYLGQDAYGSYVGYSQPTSFVVEVTPQEQGKPLNGTLVLTYGICSDICVPARQDFALDLSGNGSGNWQALKVQAARSKLPQAKDFIAQIVRLDDSRLQVTSAINGDTILAIVLDEGNEIADLRVSMPEKTAKNNFIFNHSAVPEGAVPQLRFYLLTGFGGFFQDLPLPE